MHYTRQIGLVTVLVLTAICGGRLFGDGPAPTVIRLDANHHGQTFEGIGALSAGASSRLLIDYPEPARSQILDFLFKPNFGASLHHFKVEVGGNVNSTDGCEPSHMRASDDLNFQRGYEWWLMREAKRRNPAVLLDCLEWGAPGWIGGGKFYSQDNADFLVKFIQGAKSAHGLDMNYVGIWNETPYDTAWIKLLRKTLDRNHLEAVKIVAADEVNSWSIVERLKADPALAAAIQVVGVHYPKFVSTAAAKECEKPIWSSEDGPWRGDWEGACRLAKTFNRNYIDGRMTKTIFWSLITSYYDNLPLPGSGIMRANTPWSGHYLVQPAVWATAHTTQFVQPGWKYLDDGCRTLGRGSCVTLRAPNGADYSLIVETVDEPQPQILTVQLAPGLSHGPVHVWRSNQKEQFVRLADLAPAAGTFSITLDGRSIYSLTTTTGQAKGAAEIPAEQPFPLPYHDDFESKTPGTMAEFFADQGGIFEVARRSDGRGNCLRQVMDKEGIRWRGHANPAPESFLGSTAWRDYRVSSAVRIERAGSVSLFGRVASVPQGSKEPKGYRLRVDDTGAWELRTDAKLLASGHVAFTADAWHTLALDFKNQAIGAMVDGVQAAVVADSTYTAGMAGVGSGWNRAQFDDFDVR